MIFGRTEIMKKMLILVALTMIVMSCKKKSKIKLESVIPEAVKNAA